MADTKKSKSDKKKPKKSKSDKKGSKHDDKELKKKKKKKKLTNAEVRKAKKIAERFLKDGVTREDFTKVKKLGTGDVGEVFLVKHKKQNKYYAMKQIKKKEMIQRNKVKRALTEREILATADHPFIVTLYYSFQTRSNLYFIMDHCAGGEFFKVLQRQPRHCLTEDQARFYSAEVLLALEYLHMMGFIYRDLKPENLLLKGNGHIMLTDFDLSKQAVTPVNPKLIKQMFSNSSNTEFIDTRPEVVTNSFVGTEEYIAPEVIEGFGHTSAVDWWTFGILLYEMLFGSTPFRGRTRDDTFSHILSSHGLKFPNQQVGNSAKNLIRNLLEKDPRKRLGSIHGAADIKTHMWYKPVNWALILNQKPPIIPRAARIRRDPTIRDSSEEEDNTDEDSDSENSSDDDDPFESFETITRKSVHKG